MINMQKIEECSNKILMFNILNHFEYTYFIFILTSKTSEITHKRQKTKDFYKVHILLNVNVDLQKYSCADVTAYLINV